MDAGHDDESVEGFASARASDPEGGKHASTRDIEVVLDFRQGTEKILLHKIGKLALHFIANAQSSMTTLIKTIDADLQRWARVSPPVADIQEKISFTVSFGDVHSVPVDDANGLLGQYEYNETGKLKGAITVYLFESGVPAANINMVPGAKLGKRLAKTSIVRTSMIESQSVYIGHVKISKDLSGNQKLHQVHACLSTNEFNQQVHRKLTGIDIEGNSIAVPKKDAVRVEDIQHISEVHQFRRDTLKMKEWLQAKLKLPEFQPPEAEYIPLVACKFAPNGEKFSLDIQGKGVQIPVVAGVRLFDHPLHRVMIRRGQKSVPTSAAQSIMTKSNGLGTHMTSDPLTTGSLHTSALIPGFSEHTRPANLERADARFGELETRIPSISVDGLEYPVTTKLLSKDALALLGHANTLKYAEIDIRDQDLMRAIFENCSLKERHRLAPQVFSKMGVWKVGYRHWAANPYIHFESTVELTTIAQYGHRRITLDGSGIIVRVASWYPVQTLNSIACAFTRSSGKPPVYGIDGMAIRAIVGCQAWLKVENLAGTGIILMPRAGVSSTLADFGDELVVDKAYIDHWPNIADFVAVCRAAAPGRTIILFVVGLDGLTNRLANFVWIKKEFSRLNFRLVIAVSCYFPGSLTNFPQRSNGVRYGDFALAGVIDAINGSTSNSACTELVQLLDLVTFIKSHPLAAGSSAVLGKLTKGRGAFRVDPSTPKPNGIPTSFQPSGGTKGRPFSRIQPEMPMDDSETEDEEESYELRYQEPFLRQDELKDEHELNEDHDPTGARELPEHTNLTHGDELISADESEYSDDEL